jgi:hypothetical protein
MLCGKSRFRTQNLGKPSPAFCQLRYERRSLLTADTTALFPLLNRGVESPVAVHQALLHKVLASLVGSVRRGGTPETHIFEDERWNAVRSSVPWLSWQLALQRHGLPVSVQAWETGAERTRGPIFHFLILGGCPESDPSVLLDLALAMAPYLHWRNADQEREDGAH